MPKELVALESDRQPWVCRSFRQILWFSRALALLHTRVERPLPLMNLQYGGGNCVLNYPPHFGCCVYGSSRLAQTAGIVFVGHDKEATGCVAPQFYSPAFQHLFQRRWFPLVLGPIQGPPRDAQIVRHGDFAPI